MNIVARKRVRIKPGKAGAARHPDLAYHRMVARWEQQFRDDANADGMAIFQDHLCKLNLDGEPEAMLEGTVCLIRACSAYAKLDGNSSSSFLTMQKYNPVQSRKAEYAFTFAMCRGVFGRVLVPDTRMGQPDLADLYEHPWDDYKSCGYSSLWITRIDWAELAKCEVAQLEQEVTEDLRYDYSEDEVDFCCDYYTADDLENAGYWLEHSESGSAGALLVSVNDHDPDLD